MFRSYDHPQPAYFSKEQSMFLEQIMLPEDDRVIE